MNYEVVIRRRNGRLVKAVPARSRYNSKQLVKKQELKYDDSFYFEIRDKTTHQVIWSGKEQDDGRS